ncbi:pentapeptide repeat-containing protein [Streptomyces sp. PTM05]|uniref:Pentapeptide repeat-containing protein n=1 Tax=Streptantibioticus parmotrematis TaxID=2873249 RepID=A0ABS7QZH7_9ACTN|nr:pentapeptide repeat-containing protein [Streptantibioticus parmotrematis]MBY8888620.1 pentapeptide repeat-containing protein [Streptantibioticus parmotrematis]
MDSELVDLPYADLLQPHTGGLDVEGRYDTLHFDGLTLSGQDAAGSGFLECAVTDCVLEEGSLRGARLGDVWLRGTRFVGTSLADSSWLDSTATSCVLAGVEAHGASLRRVVFRRCKFDSVNLRGSTSREVVFEECVLRDVDLGGASLTDVSFPGSSLERLHLAKARLTRVDLRGATTLDLADGHEALRGAVISPTQMMDLAPALAAALGIRVEA